MDIKELKKRVEVKSREIYPRSESPMEEELYHQLLKQGIRAEKQYKILGFFADLCIPHIHLVIEYDGEHHIHQTEKDLLREGIFRKNGWDVIRVSKNLITYNGEPQMIFTGQPPTMAEIHDLYPRSDEIIKKAALLTKRLFKERDNASFWEHVTGKTTDRKFVSFKESAQDAYSRIEKRVLN